MMDQYDSFLAAFPKDMSVWGKVDAQHLSKTVASEFGISPPETLTTFWSFVGSGYFGDRRLYFFGDGKTPMPRDSLVDWNKQNFWRDIFPEPKRGGPVFFAETCFGEQLGFRWEESRCLAILFTPDTIEEFWIATDFEQLFSEVLIDPDSIPDPNRFRRVASQLGHLPQGMHYAPIVSPLVGGTDDPRNFHFESPNVHLRTAIATYWALRSAGADMSRQNT